MRSLFLPSANGSLRRWTPSGIEAVTPDPGGFESRVAYAAAHVVADPLRLGSDGMPEVDRDATLVFRRHLWSQGLGVAEAMDTAQRGMGLDWEQAQCIIADSIEEARVVGGALVCGVATDQLAPGVPPSLAAVEEAYAEQLRFVESRGGSAILMASRALAAIAGGPEDYLEVYDAVVGEATRPVMLHWLGDMFDPALTGYWGSPDPWRALDTVVEIAGRRPGRVAGVKISLLDAGLERALRRGLPEDVRVFTGDDFNFPEMILGDEGGHSDALLGVFDAIAPAAAAALQALDRGDVDRYRAILDPTVALGRHVFAAPTFRYKTGVVFLAYLNGHQTHFRMLAGAESARSIAHLAEVIQLADRARLLSDPELAVHRAGLVLEIAGVP